MNRVAALVLAVLLAPSALAAVSDYPVNEGYTYAVVTYPLGVYNVDLMNPTAGEIVNDTYNATKLHNANVIEHRLVFTIEASASYTPDNGETGTWMITWDQDDTALGTCQNDILTRPPGGFLVGDLPFQNTDTRHCLRVGSEAKNNINHTHTLTADLSAVNNPASLEHLDISVLIEREDIYLIPQDQNELLQTAQALFPLVAFVAFAAWAYRTRSPVTYVGATALGITAVVNAYDVFGAIGTTAIAAALIIVIGEAIVAYAEQNEEGGAPGV